MKEKGENAKRGKGAPAVRAFLAEMAGAGASALQVEERLQVQTHKDRNRIRDILAALVRNGQAEIVMDEDRDEVRYALCLRPNARGAVQAKLWRFACHRFQTTRPFTAAEAAGMAECDRDYTKRYCRWLWNSGYLAIVSRGRAGALLYQVVGGKANEAAPAWNRRAEKRKNKPEGPQAGTPAPLPPPAAPAAAGIIARNPAITFFDESPSPAGDTQTIMRAALEAGYRGKLDAALEDFGRALVDITGSIGRAWEIIREMKGELLAIGETCHDEPVEPTEGHH